MGNIKIFAKDEPEILVQTFGIYSQDVGVEYDIEKCAKEKEETELTNAESIWTIREE